MSKLAITCTLDELERLMKQFVDEQYPDDLLRQLTFSHFLIWLRHQQETTDNEKRNNWPRAVPRGRIQQPDN